MDHKVTRIIAGTVYGVRPSGKKPSNGGRQGGPKFSLEPGEAPQSPEDEDAREHEPLHVSKPTDDEAGGTLDLTA